MPIRVIPITSDKVSGGIMIPKANLEATFSKMDNGVVTISADIVIANVARAGTTSSLWPPSPSCGPGLALPRR